MSTAAPQRRKPFTPAETDAINAGQCPRCYSTLAAEGQRLVCKNTACGKKGGKWYLSNREAAGAAQKV